MQKGSERIWRDTLASCPTCTFQSSECKRKLEPRYMQLFDNEPTYTTYLAMTRNSRFERDGRLIVWGLNDQEAQWLCSNMAKDIQKKYQGTVKCIKGHLG